MQPCQKTFYYVDGHEKPEQKFHRLLMPEKYLKELEPNSHWYIQKCNRLRTGEINTCWPSHIKRGFHLYSRCEIQEQWRWRYEWVSCGWHSIFTWAYKQRIKLKKIHQTSLSYFLNIHNSQNWSFSSPLSPQIIFFPSYLQKINPIWYSFHMWLIKIPGVWVTKRNGNKERSKTMMVGTLSHEGRFSSSSFFSQQFFCQFTWYTILLISHILYIYVIYNATYMKLNTHPHMTLFSY